MYYPHLSSGIRFNDCLFSEPVRLAGWVPPRFPGLFVILARDSNWAPRNFQPLCFGEFGNNSPALAGSSEYASLLRAANNKDLSVSVLPLPFSTSAQRLAIVQELVSGYNPVLQGPSSSSPDELSVRLNQLERRHQEQNEKILFLLGNIYKHFEPQVVPERRRIGFLPQALPELP
jgi:hypothetical protein